MDDDAKLLAPNCAEWRGMYSVAPSGIIFGVVLHEAEENAAIKEILALTHPQQ